MKNMQKLLLSSTITTMVCCILLVGTTFAWFADTAEVKVQSITVDSPAQKSATKQEIAVRTYQELIDKIAKVESGTTTTISLSDNIEVGVAENQPLTVKENTTIILNLNSNKITGEASSAGGVMIENKGTLNLTGAGNDGGIVCYTDRYTDTSNELYIIKNSGDLNVFDCNLMFSKKNTTEGQSELAEPTPTDKCAVIYSSAPNGEENVDKVATVNVSKSQDNKTATINGGEYSGIVIDGKTKPKVYNESEISYLNILRITGGEIIAGKIGYAVLLKNEINETNTILFEMKEGVLKGLTNQIYHTINKYTSNDNIKVDINNDNTKVEIKDLSNEQQSE